MVSMVITFWLPQFSESRRSILSNAMFKITVPQLELSWCHMARSRPPSTLSPQMSCCMSGKSAFSQWISRHVRQSASFGLPYEVMGEYLSPLLDLDNWIDLC